MPSATARSNTCSPAIWWAGSVSSQLPVTAGWSRRAVRAVGVQTTGAGQRASGGVGGGDKRGGRQQCTLGHAGRTRGRDDQRRRVVRVVLDGGQRGPTGQSGDQPGRLRRMIGRHREQRVTLAVQCPPQRRQQVEQSLPGRDLEGPAVDAA